MTTSLLQRLADDYPEDNDIDHLDLDEGCQWIIGELQMLFSSRPRLLTNKYESNLQGTVIHYGLEQGFSHDDENRTRHEILRQRIATVLALFEPRLTHVLVELIPAEQANACFSISALCASQPLLLTLIWDDAMSTFYLNP